MIRDQAETIRRWASDQSKPPLIAVYSGSSGLQDRVLNPSLWVDFLQRQTSWKVSWSKDYEIADRHLVLLGGAESDLLGSYQHIKFLSRSLGVKKLDVLIVLPGHPSLTAHQAKRIFAQLFGVCRRFIDVEPRYLGVMDPNEKLRDSIAISKFLIHSLKDSIRSEPQAGCQNGG